MNNPRRIQSKEGGLSPLEKLGLAAIVISVLAFIPPLRSLMASGYDAIFNAVDANGDRETYSVMAKGILIALMAIGAFLGSGWLLLYTNVGTKLAFLIAGAATFGWLVIGSTLFVIYAPRGLRPVNFDGLNAFQIRIPAIALTFASLILFVMFVIALDRYEKEGS